MHVIADWNGEGSIFEMRELFAIRICLSEEVLSFFVEEIELEVIAV